MKLRSASLVLRRFLQRRRAPLSILAGSLVLMLLLTISTRRLEVPEMAREPLKVEVVDPVLSDQTAMISGFGAVEPNELLEVRALVSGHAVRVHPQFIEGGRIEAGGEIFGIDPLDYEIQLESRKAALTQAESDLRIEIGNQVIAKREWELFNKQGAVSPGHDDLALRTPQRQAIEARLLSAKNDVRRAELDLDRTSVKSPFRALVIERNVILGTYVMAGSTAAKLVSRDRFLVKLRLPDEALNWIIFDTQSGDPSDENSVYVRHQLQDGRASIWPAKLEKVLGSVESTGRMAQLSVSVQDPLDPPPGKPPLLLGSYVEVEISGRTITDVYRLPRRALHEGNKIYVADGKNLFRTRVTEVALVRGEDVLVRGGFRDGDRVIISQVATPLEGMPLRIEPNQKAP